MRIDEAKMSNWYSLTYENVNEYVSDKPGAYALRNSGRTLPNYVGRSDHDLNARLKDHVANGTYDEFCFKECAGPWSAYEIESGLYWEYKEFLDNEIAPAKPE